jgi:hypothetical protein
LRRRNISVTSEYSEVGSDTSKPLIRSAVLDHAVRI